MKRNVQVVRNWTRALSVLALLISTFVIPVSTPSAEAAIVGSTGCESDVSFTASATTFASDGHCIIVFSGSPNAGGNRANSWTAPLGVTKVRVLLVGGGGSGGKGGGGSNEAGGGGAGGLILAETSTVPGRTYDFVIGGGGSGASYGSNGNGSAAFGFTANGGGKGGGSNGVSPSNPGNGGSGGGGAHNLVTGGTKNQTIGRGFDGGTPVTPSSGAGGGGAGGKGKTTSGTAAAYSGGAGGEGFCTAISGTSTCYAGGGGGTGSWSNNTQIPGAGGSGVGGAGNGAAGAENTGSGGGGQLGNVSGNGGNGGSGVLVIRWIPSGYTNSLKMYAKTDIGATSATTFSNAGKFYTSCSTTEDVFPYPGEAIAARDWGGDADGGGPIGCGADGFTIYATGWVKVPAATVRFYTKGDDGTKLQIDGVTKVEYNLDQGPVIQPADNLNNEVTGLVPDTWHRIDVWLHENGGGAYLELMWSTDGGTTKTAIPSTSLTYQFPTQITSVSMSGSLTVRESSTVTTALDTTTVKVYNDSGSSLLSRAGYFQVIDSGTASTTCASFAPAADGVGKCFWRPETLGARSVDFAYISTDTLGVNGAPLFLSSTSTAQVSSARQTLSVAAMHKSSDTDTVLTLTGTEFASLVDTTNSIFDVTKGFTLEAWVLPTDCSGSSEQAIIYKANAYALYCASGTWRYKMQGTSTAWTGKDTNVPVKNGVWQHVVVTRYPNVSEVYFYFNGEQRYFGTADGAGSGNVAVNNNALEVGAINGSGSFRGKIDEVRIYAGVTSTNGFLYESGVKRDLGTYGDTTTANTNLVAYYDMNELGSGILHNRKQESLVSQDLILSGNPVLDTLEEVTVTGAETVVKFPRSYLTAGAGWKSPVTKSQVQVLVVGGGGGGGGGFQGGGGGAGGYIETTTSISATFYPIKVGMGGVGRLACSGVPKNGETSTAFSISAAGGGAGGVEFKCGGDDRASSGTYGRSAATSGGSGGGGSGGNADGGTWPTSFYSGGSGTIGQGSSGGTSFQLSGAVIYDRYAGAGGGGACATGEQPKDQSQVQVAKGGNGGAGCLSRILGIRLAGGGGGSLSHASSLAEKGSGGIGGGGDSSYNTGDNGVDGQDGTGGGGGASNNVYGGDGGSSSSTPRKGEVWGTSGTGGYGVVAIKWSYKLNQAKLSIGQYNAFVGISSYPLNVYGGSGTGAVSRTLTDSGTANCTLDGTLLLTAAKIGTCTVRAVKAEDPDYFAETATATIYWIQWSDAYATRAPSTPTEIVLNHQTAIIKYNYDTLTVTSYQNSSGVTISSIATGATLRIIGSGFSPTSAYTEVNFMGGRVQLDLSTGVQVLTDGSGNNYLQLTVPNEASTGIIVVNSPKGTAEGATLTILSP